MTDTGFKLPFFRALKLRWLMLLRGILHLWVRARALPDAQGEIGATQAGAVCYVMNDYALSSVLILDRCCEHQALARPLLPLAGLEQSEPRAYAVLRRMRGILIRRPSTRRSSEVLGRLVAYCHAHPDVDIQLVPVTVLVGRVPDRTSGFAKTLFAENWQVAGRVRRLLSTLINGRDTIVQFSRPLSLQELVAENLGAPRTVRKVSRVLRTHFRRVKAAAIGPDLSHRRTLISGLIRAPAVREAILEKAERDGIGIEKAERLARKYAWEIAADYSYTFVRIAANIIDWLTTRIYDGVRMHHFDRFKRQSLGHEIIYVPCHRSHIDYILVSYLVYQNGLVPPHVAAGVNLNLPLVGPLLRDGGAFFLRRSFRAQKLYSAVFNEYLSTILAQGVSIEYFVEGTRSRTGRLLPPKGGMLAMTVRGYLSAPVRPVMFQPVYIGYEQLVEGSSYTRELSGAAKRSERLSDLFKALKILRHRYGEAVVSFGQPIFLDALLEARDPQWRNTSAGAHARAPWLPELVEDLGTRIMTAINGAADVNPVNLLAMVFLATPKHALAEQQLLDQLQLYRSLLLKGPLGEQVTVTERDGAGIVEYGFELRLLRRTPHAMGDILSLEPRRAVELTYFRNNAAHLFALPALVACCFLNQRSVKRKRLHRIAGAVYPFLRNELFLPWPTAELEEVLQANVELLVAEGLLEVGEDGSTLQRAEGGSEFAGHLSLLARTLLQTLERYFITIAVLAKNGSGSLTRAELEQLCILTAQRISLLHEFEAPEFYDRSLFKGFIATLRQLGYLGTDEDGRLVFDEGLDEIDRHARWILNKEIRHGISRAAPQALAGLSGE